MLSLINNVEDVEFDIELALEEQRGIQPLPFPKMDKSSAAVCKFFQRGICFRDISCPFRHTSGPKTVVCKHWLRGLCKKGDDCEYLHEYDMTKMPECYFFSKYGECSNKDCQYLHIDPNSKLRDCPWYDRGFCKHGPNCRNRHVRRVMCTNYLSGFCPLGSRCKSMHPRFELPRLEYKEPAAGYGKRCHVCNELGHVSTVCPLRHSLNTAPSSNTSRDTSVTTSGNNTVIKPIPESTGTKDSSGVGALIPITGPSYTVKPLEKVTCFKCGEKGHYANNCALSKKNLNLLKTGNVNFLK